MNEQEKTTMNIIEPEGLSNCGADSSTWCGQALTRVLIGMTLTGLTLNVLCLNYILPAIGMVFLLVGLRALRRENAGFKGGYVIAILRTFYITVWMILDTTIYADVLTGTTAAVVLTLFNLVIMLAQVVCLWSGLKALRQKAGFEAKCGAAAALIVWNIVLCALGVMNWSGWIVFGIIMIVLYIIIMRRLFALAGELDNAGCTITPVPVRVKDWQLVLSLAVLLAAGMACGYAFGCVDDWICRRLCGIDAAKPGFSELRIAPLANVPFDWTRTFVCEAGEIAVRKNGASLQVRIPPNTTAEVLWNGAAHNIGSGAYAFC